jgi:hypothetical protein
MRTALTLPVTLTVALIAAVCIPALGQQPPVPGKTVLCFSKTTGFRHTTADYGKPIITTIGEQSGEFRTICTEDERVFNPAFLSRIDCIVFNNTTGSFFNDDEKAALLSYVQSGGGIVGIHAATDCHYDWPEYGKLFGGWFDGHPWNEQVTIRIEVPEHPACLPVPSPWVIADEIYQHRDWSRKDVCVLMSLDPKGTDFTKPGMKRADKDYGIAWCKMQGKGRVFYAALGHREEVFDAPAYREHLLNAILWAMGVVDGPSEPHPLAE